MLHPNPVIAFRRQARLFSGVGTIVLGANLFNLTRWAALLILIGLVLEWSVVLPVMRELKLHADDTQPEGREV